MSYKDIPAGRHKLIAKLRREYTKEGVRGKWIVMRPEVLAQYNLPNPMKINGDSLAVIADDAIPGQGADSKIYIVPGAKQRRGKDALSQYAGLDVA